MDTVYIVTAGSYSDYHIVGVYTDKALAEQLVAHLGRDAEADIEEMPINPNADDLRANRLPFRIHMRRDGNVETVRPVNDFDEVVSGLRVQRDGSLYGTVLANSPEHAAKIANEKRIELLALDRLHPSPTR